MKTPMTHPEDFTAFAVVVDGEVAMNLTLKNEQEMHIAIFSSEPKFINVPANEIPETGSKWDGERFVSVE